MEWPNNAPYVLCLSHDVDRIKKQWYHYIVYGIKHPVIQIKSLWYKMIGKEPYDNFKQLISLEESYGVKSTFFFLNEGHKEISPNFMGRYDINSNRVVNLIKYIDSKGYDIGLHGSYYSYNDLVMLKREKGILEGILGHPVVCSRQHHLNRNARTLKIQAEIGIKYDSTIGCSRMVCDEKFCRTEEGIIEIPITLMDTVLLSDEVFNKCREVAHKGGIMMLDFHQCHFNELEYPQNVKMYEKLLKMAKEDRAWIASVREVGEWLDERL